MINLRDYREYWERVADRVNEITNVLPVTIDEQMGKKIQNLPADSLTLFVFPPIAESTARNIDEYRELNSCVIFIMAKYDPQRRSSFDLLEQTQTILEKVKGVMLADQWAGCNTMKVDVSSIELAPETELYGRFAGWSMTFKAKSV